MKLRYGLNNKEMKIIDTHAHYDADWFDDDRYELIERILSDNVLAFINIGCDIDSSNFSADLSEKYDNVFASVGIHPEMASNIEDGYIEKLKTYAKKSYFDISNQNEIFDISYQSAVDIKKENLNNNKLIIFPIIKEEKIHYQN